MNTIFHRLNSLVGVWVLLTLLVSNAHAQSPAPRGLANASRPGLHSVNVHAPRAAFTVNSTADAVDVAPGNGVCATVTNACTLRAAIQEANALAGDDIISLPAGTYTLTLAGAGENAAATGDLDINSNITLNGAGAAITTINGNWADRVLHVTGAFKMNISGVTITHGNGSGGGIRNDGGALTITDSAISDNNSGTDGGGILSSGTLELIHSTIFDNNAGADAGGISSSGVLTITHSTFDSNNAGADGGGMFNSGKVAVVASTFSDNNTRTNGGAIFSSGTLTVAGSTFSTNNASNGGGIYSGGGAVTVATSAFSGNTAWTGGGIYDGGGVMTATHSTFSDNSASTGGGVFTQFNVTIANSTFSGNEASNGEAIYTGGGALAIINSTIFGYVSDPDDIGDAVNAPAASGGVYNSAGGGGTVTLFNTIVAGHESGGNCVGVITNGGNNIDDSATCGWGSANGSLSNTNPLLGALTGSPAYFPLNTGSPAIDAGNNAVCAAAPVNNTSQNGVARPTDGDGNGTAMCDIGAFERYGDFRVYLPVVVR